jgi:sec-independent protein translocase protein TatB
MFGITWGEMAVIAIVALILIGPKDLPVVLRTMGKWITAARGMAREFQGHVDDLVRESGLDEVRRNIRENTADTLNDLANHVDPDRSLREGLDPDKLMAGDAAKKPADEAATRPAGVEPPIDPSILPPPSSAEIAAVAASVGESLGADYHPPADAAPPAEPATSETAKRAADPAPDPAKNAGAPEPGRA